MVCDTDFMMTTRGRRIPTILVDPPWQFQNKTGKIAPEHRRLSRYATMSLNEIEQMPVGSIAADTAHLYLWCPNGLLPDGLAVMRAWGFTYKSNLIWHKIRKDGGSDGRGVGFYFRNVTELVLFGVRGKKARTLEPARRQVNLLASRKREHSRKPDELYDIIEACSPGPYLELFEEESERGGSTGVMRRLSNIIRRGKLTLITLRQMRRAFRVLGTKKIRAKFSGRLNINLTPP